MSNSEQNAPDSPHKVANPVKPPSDDPADGVGVVENAPGPCSQEPSAIEVFSEEGAGVAAKE